MKWRLLSHSTASLDSFYARHGGFYFTGLLFYVRVFGNVRSSRKNVWEG
jgi:hypothetical protein